MRRFPSDAECFAAARQLHDNDLHKIWHSKRPAKPRYDELDPIGKGEFDAIIERVLMAAEEGGGLEAVSRALYREGELYGWWGNPPREFDPQGYNNMNAVERAEFDNAVDRLMKAATEARTNA